MQLVVMAALLAMAGGCSSKCRPTNVSIPVWSCGSTEYVDTTICAGLCYHEDPLDPFESVTGDYKSCNGEWTYEVKHINGCPQAVTYPVARNCQCTQCNPDNTRCGFLPVDFANCLSF